MQCAIMSSMPNATVNSFLQYLIQGTIFGEGGGGVTEHKLCVFIFPTNLSGIHLILRTIQLDIAINVHRSSRKAPIILIRF
jgi:hypothetical protein